MTIDYRHPDETFLRSIDVHELLPQQEPIVMVSRLVYLDDTSIVSEMDINADNLFVDNGHLSASGLIENIAQTCALRIGYFNTYIYKKMVQIGFIGAIRNMEITSLPESGQQITTSVDVIDEVFGMTLVSAIVKQGDQTLATTEMKIALKNT